MGNLFDRVPLFSLLFCFSTVNLPEVIAAGVVVFAPGIGGTELADAKAVVWPSPAILGTNIRRLLDHAELAPTRVLENVGLDSLLDRNAVDYLAKVGLQASRHSIPVYDSFFTWIKAEAAVFEPVAYDWRLGSSEENLRRVGDAVRRARSRGRSGEKVVLVGHSFGGLLLARWCAETNAADNDVSALITVGTPWQGAPEAFRSIVHGSDLGLGFAVERNFAITKSFDGQEFQDNLHLSFVDPSVARECLTRLAVIRELLPHGKCLELFRK